MKSPILFFFLLPPLLVLAQKPSLVVPIGHTAPVNAIAFSPDGRLLLTGSQDNTAVLWDVETGKQVLTLAGHSSTIYTVTFSPDGKQAMTGSEDKTAILWDIKTGKKISKLEDRRLDCVLSTAFSPDPGLIMTGHQDSTFVLWDRQSGQLHKQVLTSHECVNNAVYSPDGSSILTAGWENYAVLWDAISGDSLRSYRLPEGERIHSVGFSPDGTKVLIGSLDGESLLLNTKSGAVLQSFSGSAGSTDSMLYSHPTAAFSTDGHFVAISSDDGSVALWDLRSNERIQTFRGKAASLPAVAFSPDGRYLATGDYDGSGTTMLWDIQSRQAVRAFKGHAASVRALDISSDGRLLLTANAQYGARYWNLEAGRMQALKNLQTAVSDIAIAPGGQLAVTGGNDHTAILWDIRSGMPVHTLPAHRGPITAVAFSNDGQRLLTGSQDSTAILWNIEDNAPVDTFSRFLESVTSVDFDPNGQDVLIGGDNKMAIRWDIQTGRHKNVFRPRSGIVNAVAFSPDGKNVLASVRGYKTYRSNRYTTQLSLSSGGAFLYERETGEELQTYEGDILETTSVAFRPPDGSQLITGGSSNNTCKLWDTKTGALIRNFAGHSEAITSVAFSPACPADTPCTYGNGKYLFSSSKDNTVKVWNTRTGREVATLVAIDAEDWIVTTPSGLFDASPDAMELMHYVVNYDGQWEVIGLEQLKARYYEPGLLPKLLGFSEDRIRPVDDLGGVQIYPRIQANISGKQLDIQLKERNGGIGKASIFINGKEVLEEANPLPRGINPKRDSLMTLDLSRQQRYLLRHPDSTNTIGIQVYNEAGWLKSPFYQLAYQPPGLNARGDGAAGESGWMGKLNPKLYVISVGTSNYSGSQLDLQYADQDAIMMAKALQSVGTALFTNGDSLEVHCLSTTLADSTGLNETSISWRFADKRNIEATFKDIRQRAKAEDVLLVYFSGHGLAQGGTDQTQFHYLTQGIASEDDLKDPATLRAYTISSEELTRWINDIPALKQVLIIDACNSGQVVENLTGGSKSLNSSQIRALDRMQDRTGMFVLSGSASDKVSYEASEYGQGLLTYALLQGMMGVATRKDAQGKDVIDVMKLFQYARDEVPRLASRIRGIQTPMLGFPYQAASFDIGILDDEAKQRIPIGNKKPVVVRSMFFNKNTFLDDLNLAERLEAAFRKETEKGSSAKLIYVDVHDYPGAYSVSGLYEQTEEGIKLEMKLFKARKDPVRLEVESTDDPDRLVGSIVRAMKEVLRDP